ncbi:hypothetical protein QE152_g9572 [Popillia japonica]|uniref:Uncharacterized protein n=1 Tax=Popillia japonica TaxID=7064 RepID=A0AAW1LWU9_POPJA
MTVDDLAALDEIVNELDNRNDNIDVVYIPPEGDELTDEEDIDDNVVIEQFVQMSRKFLVYLKYKTIMIQLMKVLLILTMRR